MLRLIITGGGTGGHIYPGIAIARAIRELCPDAEIMFIGGKGQRESTIIPQAGFNFKPVIAQGFPRKVSFNWFKVFIKVTKGFISSLFLISEFEPDVVVATGGYVCGPVALAAFLLNVPIVVQEQNAVPGITNRILGKWAKEIYVPFYETSKFFNARRVRLTGNPIRKEISTALGDHSRLGLERGKVTITFLGGSQGSRSINSAVIEALAHLSVYAPNIQIIHQTGERDWQRVKDAYDNVNIKALVRPYFHSIEDIYSVSDLVVSRSGGITVAEITARGLPAILIPYPYAAVNEQAHNAKILERKGAALVIPDSELNGKKLADTIISLINDKNRLAKMAQNSKSLGKPMAAYIIAKSVISLANNCLDEVKS